MNKTLTLFAAIAMLAGSSFAALSAGDLIISEVAEGDSSYKFVEIHNPTGSPIDMNAEAVQLRRYANSGTVPATLSLTATIPAGGFYLVANNATDFQNAHGFDADVYNSSVISHNGNDDYDIYDSDDTVVVDGFATDNVGIGTSFAVNVVAFRIGSALPNNGDWGGGTTPANGANSPSGNWVVYDVTVATAAGIATPGSSGGGSGVEVPVELSTFSVE